MIIIPYQTLPDYCGEDCFACSEDLYNGGYFCKLLLAEEEDREEYYNQPINDCIKHKRHERCPLIHIPRWYQAAILDYINKISET